MPGPRLLLPIATGDCSPFLNCTQRDALINLILRSDFEDDGLDPTMSCAHSNGSYVLLCQNFYENSIQVENAPDAENLIRKRNVNDREASGILLIALLICVILIMVLVLTNLTLITKIRQSQKQSMKNDEQSELLDGFIEMKKQ